MGKTYTAKIPPGDFKITTPENSLLSKQAVTNKGITVPYISWTCSVMTISHFNARLPVCD